MAIDDTDIVDLLTIDKISGDVLLSITDHLPWGELDSAHLVLLQSKLNRYLSFIESGDMVGRFPETRGRKVVIIIVGKFSLSEQGANLVQNATVAIRQAGFDLRFRVLAPN
jgi:hypothetical protein